MIADTRQLRTAENLELPKAALFVAASLLAVVVSQRLHGGRWLASVALGAIAVAIWHGAFDHVLAQDALEPRLGTRWQLAFYPTYLALGAACALLWLASPVAALLLFLGYSALHFGTEGEQRLTPLIVIPGFAAGLIPIAAACFWWPQQVQAILVEMLRHQAGAAPRIVVLAAALLWPAVLVSVLGLCLRRRGTQLWVSLGLLVTLLVLFRWCSPLAAFAIYFCLWHTPEHLVSTSLTRERRFSGDTLARHLRAGLWPWLLSLAGVAALCYYGRHSPEAYAGVVLIALSALTVPHMALGELCRRLENATPQLGNGSASRKSAEAR